MKNPDAIVIGAGVVGACCALALTNAGLKVLIIDRGPVASGTTGAGEGNILVSDKEPSAELTLAIRSRDLWFEIDTDIGGGFELEAKGGVVVSRSAKGISDLKRLSALQKVNGVEVIELDGAGLRKIEPHLSESVDYGVLYPGDAQCQPMLAAAQIIRAVKKRGGSFIQGENVVKINANAGSITGVTTDKNQYVSPIIINATGTWAGEIAKLAGSYLPIMPRRGFILVTSPAPKIVHHKVYDADYVANVASSDADLQSAAVVEGTASGTILIGASRERVGFKGDMDISILRQLARQAISLFPVLADIQLLRAYRGFRPYAPDHLPVIGPDKNIAGLWHAAGHEGAGIGLAPATGDLIAAQITGRTPFMDPSAFSPDRFKGGEHVAV
ncbi:MAG: FAD-dependent oxidoreductase [Actinomycetes bacterium]|jgi:glycine/D-amino acid oxidase-like deaminating enzyme